MEWLQAAIATWYAAAIFGGALIMIADCLYRRREPSEEDVRHAAALYVSFYGSEAHLRIGDHMLGASFARNGDHTRFLRRVAAELAANSR